MDGNKLPLPAKIEELAEQVKRLEREKAELIAAGRKALAWMESVEAVDWLEDGGPETLPQVEEFREFMAQYDEAKDEPPW